MLAVFFFFSIALPFRAATNLFDDIPFRVYFLSFFKNQGSSCKNVLTLHNLSKPSFDSFWQHWPQSDEKKISVSETMEDAWKIWRQNLFIMAKSIQFTWPVRDNDFNFAKSIIKKPLPVNWLQRLGKPVAQQSLYVNQIKWNSQLVDVIVKSMGSIKFVNIWSDNH